jgi:hypothetical protein
MTHEMPRNIKHRCIVLEWPLGAACYLALGFSLGWYYTFTYYGRTGIPMPHPESCAAIVLYYFSVVNADTEIQAVHWMAVFPIAGLIWVIALSRLAPRFGGEAIRVARVFFVTGVACIPIALPGPAMAILGGWQDGGFTFDRMIAVALRRGNRSPDPWLTPLYLTLGAVSLAVQWRLLRGLFNQSIEQSLRHYLVSAVALFICAAIVGAALSVPLRLLFERVN